MMRPNNIASWGLAKETRERRVSVAQNVRSSQVAFGSAAVAKQKSG